MKKISVIVPIYKVEEYLPRCIESIINQTYKNLEIILVDDGSPDSCPQICDEYAKKDCRIMVIHKENGGLSEARNVGIDSATGEYIGFVDSDDYINKNMYEILINELERNDSDISICRHEIFCQDSENVDKHDLKYGVKCFTNIQSMEEIYGENGTEYIVAWNKLYKRELFENIRYPIGKINEDEYITYKLLFNSRKVTYVDCKLYYYYQRDDSIMGSKVSKRNLDGLEALEKRTEFLRTNSLDYLVPLNERALFINYLILYNKFRQQKEKGITLLLKDKMKVLYKSIKKHKDLTLSRRIKYMVVNYIPQLFLLYKSRGNK